MSFFPKVSVIIRTCHRFGLLELALNSVVKQTYGNIEIIIVDDGVCKVEQDFLQHFDKKRVVKLVFPPTKGRSSAANTGIREASGRFICFLDDDDEFMPNHISTLVERSLTTEGLVYSNALHSFEKYNKDTNQSEMISQRQVLYNQFDRSLFLFSNYIPLHTILFPKEALENTSFDEDISLFEDWDLLIRLSSHYDFTHVDEITCLYRIWSNEQISRSEDRQVHLKAYQHVITKHFERLSPEVIGVWWDKIDNEINLLKDELASLRKLYDSSQEALARYSDQDEQLNQLRLELAAGTSRHKQLTNELAKRQQTLSLYIQENENKEKLFRHFQQQQASLRQQLNLAHDDSVFISTRHLCKIILLRILPKPAISLIIRIKHMIRKT